MVAEKVKGSCWTLKILKSDLVALKNKYFSVENLKNIEMKVCCRESFQQCFSFLTLRANFKSTETNHCIYCFHF